MFMLLPNFYFIFHAGLNKQEEDEKRGQKLLAHFTFLYYIIPYRSVGSIFSWAFSSSSAAPWLYPSVSTYSFSDYYDNGTDGWIK